ncbi:hypothetical protein COV18_07450 [Candidatus Woesearchaeota archaeon CG10_big_fil_rev_8_21_14_0_10_37_12]|nr:MAG: hypothetical protein COV18_07450 [Candidatus Woesearchaeota archaeon CG10_big_fil_rev_8_21_14_0_10_37_12]
MSDIKTALSFRKIGIHPELPRRVYVYDEESAIESRNYLAERLKFSKSLTLDELCNRAGFKKARAEVFKTNSGYEFVLPVNSSGETCTSSKVVVGHDLSLEVKDHTLATCTRFEAMLSYRDNIFSVEDKRWQDTMNARTDWKPIGAGQYFFDYVKTCQSVLAGGFELKSVEHLKYGSVPEFIRTRAVRYIPLNDKCGRAEYLLDFECDTKKIKKMTLLLNLPFSELVRDGRLYYELVAENTGECYDVSGNAALHGDGEEIFDIQIKHGKYDEQNAIFPAVISDPSRNVYRYEKTNEPRDPKEKLGTVYALLGNPDIIIDFGATTRRLMDIAQAENWGELKNHFLVGEQK